MLEALGPEVNVLIGGSGYDTLRARTGGTEADRLLCNLGEDEFAADPSDTTDSCEKPLP